MDRKNKTWSEEELEILDRYKHLACQTISDRLRGMGYPGRTPAAVQKKLEGINRFDGEFYDMKSVAELTGFSTNTISKEISSGRLIAHKRTETHWYIKKKDLMIWIVNERNRFPTRAVNARWLIELFNDLV